MRKNCVVWGAVLLLVIAAFVWWNGQTTFLQSVHAEDLSRISVRDGSTGARFEIDTNEDIAYIVQNIQKQSFHKNGIALFRMGTLFTLSFYDETGHAVSTFILNGDHTIRKDPFFYETEAGSMQDVIARLHVLERDHGEP